jgi:ADP-ribose pyrophosphatase
MKAGFCFEVVEKYCMTDNVVASEHRYHGRVLNLRLDTVALPDGQTYVREVVEHAEAVAIVPVNAQGEVYFVRQFRAGPGGPLLEIPAGTLEPGESPEAGARREIEEEIGYAAARWERLGSFYLAPGYSTELIHLFLARDLTEARRQGDFDEDIETEKAPLEDFLRRALAGEPTDVKTMAALLLARGRLNRSASES